MRTERGHDGKSEQAENQYIPGVAAAAVVVRGVVDAVTALARTQYLALVLTLAGNRKKMFGTRKCFAAVGRRGE